MMMMMRKSFARRRARRLPCQKTAASISTSCSPSVLRHDFGKNDATFNKNRRQKRLMMNPTKMQHLNRCVTTWATEEEMTRLRAHLDAVRAIERAKKNTAQNDSTTRTTRGILSSRSSSELCAETFRRYDPDRLARHFGAHPWRVLFRIWFRVA